MDPNSAFMVFFVGTSILLLFAFTLVIFLITHKKKRLEHLMEKQKLENEYQNQLLLSRLEVQEQSFKYFSEEIHDNVGQVLSLVKMQLYSIRNTSTEPDVVSKINAGTELLGKAISDLRNISHTLSSAFVDSAGLESAVKKDLDYISSTKEVQCRLHKSGDAYNLGNEKELMIFRIIQEAISNALKHASPTMIDVSLSYNNGTFAAVVNDNGAGFEMKGGAITGLGLNNMQMRAKMLNGDLHIASQKNKGTSVTLTVNVETEASAA